MIIAIVHQIVCLEVVSINTKVLWQEDTVVECRALDEKKNALINISYAINGLFIASFFFYKERFDELYWDEILLAYINLFSVTYNI